MLKATPLLDPRVSKQLLEAHTTHLLSKPMMISSAVFGLSKNFVVILFSQWSQNIYAAVFSITFCEFVNHWANVYAKVHCESFTSASSESTVSSSVLDFSWINLTNKKVSKRMFIFISELKDFFWTERFCFDFKKISYLYRMVKIRWTPLVSCHGGRGDIE